jgi:hypothetical protein
MTMVVEDLRYPRVRGTKIRVPRLRTVVFETTMLSRAFYCSSDISDQAGSTQGNLLGLIILGMAFRAHKLRRRLVGSYVRARLHLVEHTDQNKPASPCLALGC